MSKPVLMWFRRDLRLRDNLALQAAMHSGAPVIPVFILDPAILHSDKTRSPRLSFMLNALKALDGNLREYGTRLLIEHGDPVQVLSQLLDRFDATMIYFNRDYTPYARRRDNALAVPHTSLDDAVLHAPGTVMKTDGNPYVVFTPFKKQFLRLQHPLVVNDYLDAGRFWHIEANSSPVPTIIDLGFPESFPLPETSEKAALHRLRIFTHDAIYVYKDTRNRLVADPWHDKRPGSSYLSPYLRFGLLSPRQAYAAAQEAALKAPDQESQQSVESFISELIWREFYIHIMYHFPYVTHSSFQRKYDALGWQNDPRLLQAWKDGRTGYPVVDAAMRQLKAIGWMPNRARMTVASFLTKDLLIDWRQGERHFMHYLIDGDPAANNGGWQWAAGTGTDAQPYFRVFNPVSQSKNYDPDGSYIRHWVPELTDVPDRYIHTPWQMPNPPADYPPPIVEHQVARQRALEMYKAVRKDNS